MWTAVFRTGTHTDSGGNTRTWKEEDLEAIAKNYDPARHEAPVVIGHPKENSPAWGWVEGLKRKGDVLYASLRLVPEFMGLLRKGLFRKRSVSLYPDMTLRHVGFLGAQPPAVKGLPDIPFSSGEDGAFIELDFSEEMIKGKEVEKMKSFIEKLRRLLREELGEAEDFSAPEALRAKEKELREKEAAMRRREARSFCESLLAEGRLTPAMMKSGVAEFMEYLSQAEGSHQFSEEGGEATTPLEFFRGFLRSLPRSVLYEETLPAEKSRQRLVEEHMRANPGSTYRDAVLALSAKQPELFER
jgi:hypothetical protein